jgi:hypothetical protein
MYVPSPSNQPGHLSLRDAILVMYTVVCIIQGTNVYYHHTNTVYVLYICGVYHTGRCLDLLDEKCSCHSVRCTPRVCSWFIRTRGHYISLGCSSNPGETVSKRASFDRRC